MTMTPIEEAAKAIYAEIDTLGVEGYGEPTPEQIATIIKRVLSERVPARPGAGYTNPNSASEAEGWNDCREYLGLED